jgi:cell division protein DivIC
MGQRHASSASVGKSAARPARARTKRRIRWSRFGVFLVLAYLVVTFGSVEWRIFQAQRVVARLEQAIAVEQQRAVLLEAEIAYRDTDEYIELIARRELGLVRPGEVPVLVGTNR